jgi:hypothetical protein
MAAGPLEPRARETWLSIAAAYQQDMMEGAL